MEQLIQEQAQQRQAPDLPPKIWALIYAACDRVDLVALRLVAKITYEGADAYRTASVLRGRKPIHLSNGANYAAALAVRGYFDLLKWARTSGCTWDERVTARAAACGHLDMLRWACAAGCSITHTAINEAARHGHLGLIKQFHAEGYAINARTFSCAVASGNMDVITWCYDEAVPWDERACTAAAESGRLDILQWLRARGCPWSLHRAIEAAAKGRHPVVLRWIVGHGVNVSWAAWVNLISSGDVGLLDWLYTVIMRDNAAPQCYSMHCWTRGLAVEFGRVDVLDWAERRGMAPGKEECFGAAVRNQLHVLKWLRARNAGWGDGGSVPYNAIFSDEMLDWLRAHDCPWANHMLMEFAKRGDIGAIRRSAKDGATPYKIVQHVKEVPASWTADDIAWLVSVGVTFDSRMIEQSAARGDYDQLDALRHHVERRDGRACAAAAGAGRLDVLVWLREHNFPWDRKTTGAAADAGHIEVLQWALDHDCPYTGRLAGAAVCGNLDMMEMLHKRGVPLCTDLAENAASGGHTNVLEWLRNRGFPHNAECLDQAVHRGRHEVLDWAVAACGETLHVPDLDRALVRGCVSTLDWAWRRGLLTMKPPLDFGRTGLNQSVLEWAYRRRLGGDPRLAVSEIAK